MTNTENNLAPLLKGSKTLEDIKQTQNNTNSKIKKTIDNKSDYITDPVTNEKVYVGNTQYNESLLERYHIKWVSSDKVGKNIAKGYKYCEDKKHKNAFSTYERKTLNEIDPLTQKPKQHIPLFIEIEEFNRMQDFEHRPVDNKGLPQQVDDVKKHVSERKSVVVK